MKIFWAHPPAGVGLFAHSPQAAFLPLCEVCNFAPSSFLLAIFWLASFRAIRYHPLRWGQTACLLINDTSPINLSAYLTGF